MRQHSVEEHEIKFKSINNIKARTEALKKNTTQCLISPHRFIKIKDSMDRTLDTAEERTIDLRTL